MGHLLHRRAIQRHRLLAIAASVFLSAVVSARSSAELPSGGWATMCHEDELAVARANSKLGRGSQSVRAAAQAPVVGDQHSALLQQFQSQKLRPKRGIQNGGGAAAAASATAASTTAAGKEQLAGVGIDPWDLVPQCFPWSRSFSIARADFEYPNALDGGTRRNATQGELIPFRCDGIVCPNIPVQDCYMDESICGEDQWCQLEDQMRFGPWGMAGGETPNFGAPDCAYLKENKYSYFFNQVCQGKDHWGPWLAVRGRCVPFRREQQSCNAYLGAAPQQGGKRMIRYFADEKDGRPPFRPMVCGDGLACTGDVEPLPHTCVKIRPPNVCFQGPWWDSSSWCKVGSQACNRFSSGLPRRELEHAAQALIMQLPVDIYQGPDNIHFWQDPEADVARDLINNIIEALWPASYRGATVFPLPIPDPRKAGLPGSCEWNDTVALAMPLYRQSNKVWSTIHSLVHNCQDPLSAKQIAASRAMAIFLRQHFMCSNCRGLWANTVLNHIGLPPDSSAREEHKLWWWRAHNMVSEHAASTRGGHPWVWLGYTDTDFAQFGKKYSPLITCQNAWFLPKDDIDAMWDIPGETIVAELEEQHMAAVAAARRGGTVTTA